MTHANDLKVIYDEALVSDSMTNAFESAHNHGGRTVILDEQGNVIAAVVSAADLLALKMSEDKKFADMQAADRQP